MRPVEGERAFTLIEMLTVIAILSVLAALLMPAILAAKAAARKAMIKTNIASLVTALSSYCQDYGVYPPDGIAGTLAETLVAETRVCNDGNPPATTYDKGTVDKPSEALVWYLGTAFTNSSTLSNGNALYCRDNALDTGVNPNAPRVWALETRGPYMEFKADQLMDYDHDGFKEFGGPWGMPYFYNARGGIGGDAVHNPASFDLYHLGDNRRTRQNSTPELAPASTTEKVLMEANPDDRMMGNDMNQGQVGAGGLRDGNAVNPPGYTDDDQDDFNNW